MDTVPTPDTQAPVLTYEFTPALKGMVANYFKTEDDVPTNHETPRGRHTHTPPGYLYAVATSHGVLVLEPGNLSDNTGKMKPPGWGQESDLGAAVHQRASVIKGGSESKLDQFITGFLLLRTSQRWREAASTALLGDWADPLMNSGVLPRTAFGDLKAETRLLHRDLVPLWRRGTRYGRVLSLDAALGDGLSLYDLVSADADVLNRIQGKVYEDDRLNAVLRGLEPAEQQVVFAYAEGYGTTWEEAAAVAGAVDPEAFGERVRRKAQRLAAEQRRRMAQRQAVRPSE